MGLREGLWKGETLLLNYNGQILVFRKYLGRGKRFQLTWENTHWASPTTIDCRQPRWGPVSSWESQFSLFFVPFRYRENIHNLYSCLMLGLPEKYCDWIRLKEGEEEEGVGAEAEVAPHGAVPAAPAGWSVIAVTITKSGKGKKAFQRAQIILPLQSSNHEQESQLLLPLPL